MADIYDVGSGFSLVAQAASVAGTGRAGAVWAVGSAIQLGAQQAFLSGVGVASSGAPQSVFDIGSVVSLVAQPATMQSSSGVVIEDVGATASLVAQSAILQGFSTAAKTGAGALAAEPAVVNFLAQIAKVASGALAAQPATLVGSLRFVITGVGALQAGSPQIASTTRKTTVAQGGMQASPAVVVGVLGLQRKVTAALLARPAVVFGVGGAAPAGGVGGAGELAAQSASLSTSNGVNRLASGAMLAERALVVGAGARQIRGTGVLRSDPAFMQLDLASGDLITWEMDDAIWGQPSVIHARDWPVFPRGQAFFQADFGQLMDKEPVRVVLERTGLSILGRDRQGNWKVNAGVIKFVSGVWPYLKGTPGTEILVYVGSQMRTEEAITWEGPYKAILGETEFLDFTVSGRYIAVRFESVGQPPWELVSYDLDLTTVGER